MIVCQGLYLKQMLEPFVLPTDMCNVFGTLHGACAAYIMDPCVFCMLRIQQSCNKRSIDVLFLLSLLLESLLGSIAQACRNR
jgi:hypothetical protein